MSQDQPSQPLIFNDSSSQSFEGVAKTLAQLYQPLDVPEDATLFADYLHGRRWFDQDENQGLSLAPSKAKQMINNRDAICEVILPALPRAAAVRLVLLRNNFDKSADHLRDHQGVYNVQAWRSQQCQAFIDMQQIYLEMVDIAISADPQVRQSRQQQLTNQLAVEQEEAIEVNHKRQERFRQTAAGISGHEKIEGES